MKTRGSTRWLAMALAVCLAVAALPIASAGAVNGKAFQCATSNSDIGTEVCYYSDDYFNAASTVYQPALATASICLAMSAFASTEELTKSTPNYADQAKNAVAFYGDTAKGILGCQADHIMVNDAFKAQPSDSTIGVIVGHKMISAVGGGTIPLVIVAIRGYNYESEWAGNFKIGTNGDHLGFSEAADQALAFVSSYIQSKLPGAPAIKLWITGFSRAAATANLTAAKIDDAIANHTVASVLNASLTQENLYAYTFETPAGSTAANRQSARYANIFNIINPHDLVPMVAPDVLDSAASTQYGFGRYGVDKYLPSNETHAGYAVYKAAMLAQYNAKNNETAGHAPKYVLETFMPYRIVWDGQAFTLKADETGIRSRGIYTYEFLTDFTDVQLKSRDHYVNVSKLQSALHDLMIFVMKDMGHLTFLEKVAFFGALAYELYENWDDVWDALCRLDYTKMARTVQTILIASIKLALKSRVISNEALQKGVKAATDLVISMMQANPAYIITLFYNKDGLLQPHAPELCKAWLETMDDHYLTAPKAADEVLQSGEYRMVCAVGDVTLRVYKADGAGGETLAATLQQLNGQLLTAPTGSGAETLVSGQTAEGELYALLPVNAAYRLEMTAAKDTPFIYYVKEMSPAVVRRVKRLTSWHGTLAANDTLVSQIAAFSAADARKGLPDGSDYGYTLSAGSKAGTSVIPLGDLKRAALNSSHYCYVSVSESPAELGHAWSAGYKPRFTATAVEAAPAVNARFLGWQDDNGDIVSSQPLYVFNVPDQPMVHLTALFEKKPETNLPQTGDETPVGWLAALMGLAALGAAWLALAAGRNASRIRRRGGS